MHNAEVIESINKTSYQLETSEGDNRYCWLNTAVVHRWNIGKHRWCKQNSNRQLHKSYREEKLLGLHIIFPTINIMELAYIGIDPKLCMAALS